MSDHYFITADQGHLRIYVVRTAPGQREAALDPVESMDFPAGVKGYTDRETAMAGRFQGSRNQAAAAGAPGPGPARAGMSIDERLPMQREESRRRARDVAAEIETFLAARPDTSWDFAGPAEFHQAVIEHISARVRNRLRRTIPKDLVNQRAEDLRAHFAAR